MKTPNDARGDLVKVGAGRLGRRQLLRQAFLLSASVPAVSALLAACAPAQAPTVSRPDQTPTAGQPKRGGVLRIGVLTSPNKLDPALGNAIEEFMVNSLVYSKLTRVTPDFKATPDLATSWQPTEKGTVWTFELNPAAKFHSGRAVTADDVVFTYQRVLNKATGSPGRTAIGPIEDVSAKNPSTVAFKLTGPFADFPVLAGVAFTAVIPKENAANLNSTPVGSGPFKFKERVPGQQTTLIRNPEYWEPNLPLLDEIRQLVVPEAAGQVAMLKGGDLDIMYFVDIPLVQVLKGDPNIVVAQTPGGSVQPIVMRSDVKPFNDVRVRQAFKAVVDRKAMLTASVQGFGVVQGDHPVAPENPFYSALTLPGQDHGKAKRLLAEAGYPDGLKVTLHASSGRPGNLETALAFKEMAKPAGIDVSVQNVEWSKWLADVWNKESFAVSNWFVRPTADDALFPFYKTGGSWNEHHYSDPKMDELLDKGRFELDATKRKEIYTEVQKRLLDDGPSIIGYFQDALTAYRKQVNGFKPSPLKWFDGRQIWLDKS